MHTKFSNLMDSKLKNQYSRKDYEESLERILREQTGFDFHGNFAYVIAKLFEYGEVRDILDFSTYAYKTFLIIDKNYSNASPKNSAEEWRRFIENCFREEGLNYSMDSKGVVHFFVDEQFEKDRIQTISFLEDDRLSYAKEHLIAAIDALEGEGLKNKQALKDMFDAVENVCKQIDARINRLGSNEVEKYIKPLYLKNIQTEEEKTFATHLIKGFKDWVDGHHMYRHAPGAENFTPPSLNTTVLAMSQGMAYLRLLSDIFSNTKTGNR